MTMTRELAHIGPQLSDRNSLRAKHYALAKAARVRIAQECNEPRGSKQETPPIAKR